MKLVTTDLWTSDANLILVTTNATINGRGELVMGRGAALEAKRRYLGLATRLGKRIAMFKRENPGEAYKVIIDSIERVGAFQVKWDYDDDADLGLIRASTDRLLDILACPLSAPSGPWPKTVALNFPGIGWGGLKREDVLPIIERLPDSVTIHEAPKPKLRPLSI